MCAAFCNRPEDEVLDALDGLVATTPHLGRLDGFPSIKVVYDCDFDGDATVAVVSGGGSGHEPAFASYVGRGLLAAAAAGDVFAAPPEEAVLAAIRQVAGAAGCLLVVLNYTGDRLNFGAAAERAKAEGLRMELAVVADDCALPGKPAVGRRGIAGAALVLKAAGAAAAGGAPLGEVAALAAAVGSSLGTMGCSLSCCTLPGQPPSQRLGPGEMELGLGIHGEPGAARGQARSAREVVDALVSTIAGGDGRCAGACYLPIGRGQAVVLLVNNLGSTTAMEMGVVAGEAVRAVSQSLGAHVERIYVGAYVTSLNMHGVSVTLLRLPEGDAKEPWLAALDAPTAAPVWPRAPGAVVPGKTASPVPTGGTDAMNASAACGAVAAEGPSDDAKAAAAAAVLRRCVDAACQALLRAEAQLNALDAAVGDGDCGTTLAKGATAVRAALEGLPLLDPGACALSISRLAGASMGGTSGALMKILFAAAGAALASRPGPLSVATAANALRAGVAAVGKYGGAAPGDRTMLDALAPAAAALHAAADSGAGGAAAAGDAAAAARRGAEATAGMSTAGAGRSSYVPAASLRGVQDPGAAAVAIWLDAVAAAFVAGSPVL